MDTTALDTLQGELERLFSLEEMKELSTFVLGFDSEQLGSTNSAGAFARALVTYCSTQEALPALVDAICLSAEDARSDLHRSLGHLQNGELQPGTLVGNLRVVKKLGEGGLSVVYLAERASAGAVEQAAVKVIRPEYARDPSAVQRYTTAARFLQRLRADGLLTIKDVGRLPDQRPFIATEYLQGQSLSDRIRRSGSLHLNEARPIFEDVLEALSALHKRGLVHGDVKVENVFLVRDDGQRGSRAILMDACSDRLLVSRRALGATTTGILPVLGTAKALSPEQARGQEPDARSDLYAFGTLMYEVLTGRPPFDGDSAIDVIADHLGSAPAAPSQHGRKGWISEAMDQLILRALEKDPESRFSNARKLLEALSDAARRPAKLKAFDEATFGEARAALLRNASDARSIEALEQVALESDGYARVAAAFMEAGSEADDAEAREGLLFRAARIYEHDLHDAVRAERAYQKVLERDSDNEAAMRGLENARRESGDHAGLIEVLLERIERTPDQGERLPLLKEVASIYDRNLKDAENASFAYTQVLLANPGDEEARKGLRRAAGNQEALWSEALTSLSETAETLTAGLSTSEDERLAMAEAALAEAETQAEQYRAHYASVLEQRRAELAQQTEHARAERAALREQAVSERAAYRAAADAERMSRQEELAQAAAGHEAELGAMRHSQAALRERVSELETLHAQALQAVEVLQLQVTERSEALEAAHGSAEQKVEAYEQLEAEAGDSPSEEQALILDKLAEEAETAVNEADAIEQGLTALTAELGAAQEQAGQLDLELQRLFEELEAASGAIEALQAQADEQALGAADLGDDDFNLDDDLGDGDVAEVDEADLDEMMLAMDHEPALTEEEQMMLDAAEAQLSEARSNVAALRARAEDGSGSHLEQDRKDAVGLYLLVGEYYAEQLRRPDYALPYFSKALELDPKSERAYDGVSVVYRQSEAYDELTSLLLRRASQAGQPSAARDLRCEAAHVMTERLGDHAQAKALFSAILAEDPSHAAAQVGLSGILMQEEDYSSLHSLLLSRVKTQTGESKVDTLALLAQLEEGQLGLFEDALQHYGQVLDEDGENEDALHGMERLAGQLGNPQAMLRSLTAQAARDLTPKQRIGLWERIGQLQVDEFVDHDAAMQAYERILEIDPRHQGALTALAGLYRQLGKFESCARVLVRLSELATGMEERFTLLLEAARIEATELGNASEAIALCERILASDSRNSLALSQIAELRAAAGDLSRAVEAVEQLADQAAPGAERALQLLSAGKMAEKAGDNDAAVMRYKRALDEDASCVEAAERLYAIYQDRGDTHGAVEMLRRAAQATTGTLKRAQLLSELGKLQADELGEDEDARASFEEAIALEPTNTLATVGLGKLALEDQNFDKAAAHFDVALSRMEDLGDEEAADIFALAGDAFEKVGRSEDAVEAFKRVCELRPASLSAHERHADSVATAGDTAAAIELYSDILSAFESRLSESDSARLLLARGELELTDGDGKAAVATFKRANALSPSPEALSALTRAHEAVGSYREVINLLQHRSAKATSEEERFALLVRSGDVFLEKLHDRNAAIQTYNQALDERPDDRNLLTKLMAIYSDASDWPRLIEVILRIAEMVSQPDQLAKYYNTAATIAHRQLGRFDEAANYYEEALSQLPVDAGDAQFVGLCECLSENQDWERLDQVLEARYQRKRDAAAPPQSLAELLDKRAELLRDRLGRNSEALELFEEAQSIDPDNAGRREMLTAIYTREPKRYFARAIAAHRVVLDGDPTNLAALRAMRRIYTSGKRPDESFCLCQALRFLKAADADEEKFFKKYRLTRLAKFKHPLDETLFRSHVLHPNQDPALTAILTTLTPAMLALQSQPLASFGLTGDLRIQPEHDTTAMGKVIAHVGDAMALRLPDVYHCPQDQGGLSFLFTNPPALGIGQGAAAGGPQQALAFIAARHLSFYRPGAFPRQLVPTGTGLRAWLMASIRLVAPQFGVPANLEGQVNECLSAIKQHLTGPQRDGLRSLTQKLLDAAPELDMRRYIMGVDLTADRAGFVLANDLKLALAVVEASPEDSASLSRAERSNALLAYATSEEYLDLRKRLGIALGG